MNSIFKTPRAWSRQVTSKELIVAVIGLVILFGPLVSLAIAPDNRVVVFLFGGYRLAAYYALAFAAAILLAGRTRSN